ncbi:L-threonylcarbamoyladenylate synthase [Bacillus thermophilus]|uniref:Threonylcarbamoyl-AMP synthase n=1 Tax=Siminovitchia thermophila TaxID=1245522 RepID=A0ABS2R4B4_9BACI|nr:L-threonylcarbamoyladenylate synthase [Siminovitchia thermophila]MBM7714483.1 L-threonylcarbamoyladenylate synthase [Siminovitchia thermophila]
MKTTYWSVDNDVNSKKNYPQIVKAAELIKKNEVVAFPTETVYGLGANATSDEAVAKIFAAKGRPADNPLIVHIATFQQLKQIAVDISDTAMKLMRTFWPGPLTLIFNKKPGAVSRLVTAGLNTVAVRMPDHPLAMALIRESGHPIAAPSANKSGKPSPTTAKHVQDDLDGIVAGIVDGGPAGVGVESTVVDCTVSPPVILRPGGISKEDIEAVIGPVEEDPSIASSVSKPKSPGMKYRHYAPDAPLYLADGEQQWIQQLIDEKMAAGLKVGILAPQETASFYKADVVVPCGSKADPKSSAQTLYQALRFFENSGVDIIFSEVFPRTGVGAAIMNRLEKAASHRWMKQHMKDQD